MPKVDYPEFDKYPQLKGVFVGGCVLRGDGSSFRAKAHAHTGPANKAFVKTVREYYEFYHPEASELEVESFIDLEINHIGWICVRSAKRLYNANGQPSNTMRHELAHILTEQGHTQTWANMARSLGCRIPKNRYRSVK